MKRLLWAVAMLTLFVFPMNAQNNNYSRLWSKVRQAEKEGKPQTAAGYLKELEEKTIRNGDELEQLAVSEALYEKLREYNWKEANAYSPAFNMLRRKVMIDSLDAYIVKYEDHPRVMKLLHQRLLNRKSELDRWGRKPAPTGEDYLRIREEAQSLLKHKYVGTYRKDIQNLIDQMDSRSLSTEEYEVLAPGDEVTYKISARNVAKVSVKLYRLLDNKVFSEAFSDASEGILRRNGTLVSEQTLSSFRKEYNISEEQSCRVAFPEAGVYVVFFAADGGETCYDQVYVSDVAGAVRIRDGRLEVYAADCRSGRPYSEGSVSIYKNTARNNKSSIVNLRPWKKEAFRCDGFRFVDDGGAVADRENDYLLRIEAERDIYAPLMNIPYRDYRPIVGRTVVRRGPQMRLLTDRALYKPSDTIRFKIICYEADQTSGKVSPGKEVGLSLRHTSDEKPVAKLKLVTNEYGSAAGTFTLPEGSKNGIYRVECENMSVGRIRVEEYKRPSFTLSLQPVEEPLAYGDVIKQTGQMRSYAGFSVAGGEVRYEVNRTSHSRTTGRYLGREKVLEGIVISDNDGRFEIAFPSERPAYKDHEDEDLWSDYSVHVRVTDPQGETHESGISIPVGDVPVDLDIRLPENEHFEGRLIVDKDKVKDVTVGASTLNGTPYAAVCTYTVADASGKTVFEGSCTGNEPFAVAFASLPSGDYRLRARTEFRGREITTERNVVVMSTDDRKLPFQSVYFYYAIETEGAIEFLLGTTEDDLYLEMELFDGDRQLYREGVHLQNEMRRFSLPYKDSYRSAVKMSVFGFRGGKTLDYTYQFTRPGDVRLDVAVETFRDKTTPGSEETMTVRAPAGSELAVTIYDVTTDRYGANSFFFRPLREYASVGSPSVQTSLFVHEWYFSRGMRSYRGDVNLMAEAMVEEEALPFALAKSAGLDDGAAADDGAAPDEEVPEFEGRSNFDELIAFYPQIEADPSGRTVIRYRTGDLLSTFRVLVLAHDKNLHTGDASAEFVVQKELMVLPNVPLFVTEGDLLVLKSKIVNLSSREVKGTAYVELSDGNGKKLRMKGLESQKKTLLAGAQTEVAWTVTVPGGSGRLTAKIWFATPAASDGEQHEITVVPGTVTLTEAASFIIGGKHGHKYYEQQLHKQFGASDPKIEYAEYSTLDAVKQSLPEAAKPASDNAIDWMNQLYINQMRNYVLQDDPASYEAFRHQAFSKLKTFMSSDGGLQWFQGMKSNTLLTLYVLEKLGQLRSVGAFTPSEDELAFIRRAVGYIDGRIDVQGSRRNFQPFSLIRDFAVRSLWFDIPLSKDAKAVFTRFINGTEDGWQKLSILEKSQLTNLMLRAAKTDFDDKRFPGRIKLLRGSLKDYAVENPTVGCYFPNAVMPFRGLMNSEIYAHAQLIETFGALGEKKMVDGIAQWLLLQKHNQAWESTVATTDAVHALVSSKAKDLKLGAVYYTYTTKLERVKASANELSVRRRCVRTGTGAPLSEGETLHVGDRITVYYDIDNTENRSFVQMRAMRPACFYPVDERSYFSWWGFYREVKPSATNYYWELLPEEHTTVTEEFFVTQEGRFNSGLIEIECLYAKEYRGHTDTETIISK